MTALPSATVKRRSAARTPKQRVLRRFRDVVMVDFSYKRPVLEQIRDRAASGFRLSYQDAAKLEA